MDRGNKPTIIVVENCLGYTGALKAILQVAEEAGSEYRFVFVLPKGSAAGKYLDDKKIACYYLPFVPIKKSLRNVFLYLPYLILNIIQLNRIVKREKAFLIHSNDLYNLAPLLIKVFNKRIKVLSHIRILPSAYPGIIYKLWVWCNKHFADIIVGVSMVALKQFNDVPKARLVYDGLMVKEKYPYNFSSASGSKLLYLSNYTPGKGHDIAIEAIAHVHSVIPDVELTIAGDTFGTSKNIAYKESLIEKVKDLKLEGWVRFEGFKSDTEREFKSHTLFLNLSEAESFSFTCLESLYFGTPCIAYASGGPQEILADGEYGTLLKERKPEVIAESIINLLQNPLQLKVYSQMGREYVREKFNKKNTTDKLIGIYNELFEKKH